MEKTFIHSILFSTAILVVYVLVSPPQSLSAGSFVELDPNIKVHKGTILEMDQTKGTLVVEFAGDAISVFMNASTSVQSPDGEQSEMSFLRDGTAIYVFGTYNAEIRGIQAEKIVMRNPSPMARKTPSRAELESMRKLEASSSSSALDELSLTAK